MPPPSPAPSPARRPSAAAPPPPGTAAAARPAAGPAGDGAAVFDALVADLSRLHFAAPVTHVYNPLAYARGGWDAYWARFGGGRREVLLLGMNPGPWGMAQTGVPFGAVPCVRDFLGLAAAIGQPPRPHPKRPITGFACGRSEISGERLWGWVQRTWGTPEAFFARFFVHNYCPLAFMEASGRNRTPDKLPTAERRALFAACDRALCALVDRLRPAFVVGIGAFAGLRAREALGAGAVRLGHILHPSPASPLAQRDWGGKVTQQLRALGVAVP